MPFGNIFSQSFIAATEDMCDWKLEFILTYGFMIVF